MHAPPTPAWFSLTEEVTPATMARLAESLRALPLPIQLRFLPLQAHWFVLDSLFLANRANREGMHANALALTRQCLEAISVIELGIAPYNAASEVLARWEKDEISAGEVRKWLSTNAWPSYGSGLWSEPWSEFMTHLARAIQPYAHYTTKLAQWQLRLHGARTDHEPLSAIVEWKPRAYDPQKATRITLFHAILTFCMARIWIAASKREDKGFEALISRLGKALGESKYLDGRQTDWEQQFWAMVWSGDGGTVLE